MLKVSATTLKMVLILVRTSRICFSSDGGETFERAGIDVDGGATFRLNRDGGPNFCFLASLANILQTSGGSVQFLILSAVMIGPFLASIHAIEPFGSDNFDL